MRAETIIELARFVASPGFTVQATIEAFGPVVPTHLPRTVRFAPRDPLYGRVEIQTRGGTEPSMLTVQLAKLVRIDFRPLVAVFGQPEEEPRMEPDDPIPWCFTFPGGSVTLETTSDEPLDVHEVACVQIRRFVD